MGALPPPLPPPSATPGPRGFKRWPLWAKISAPIAAVLIAAGTAGAISGHGKDKAAAPDTSPPATSILPLAAVGDTVASTTPATEPSTTAPTTTVQRTTLPATTQAPTTLPTTTPAPTPAPTPAAPAPTVALAPLPVPSPAPPTPAPTTQPPPPPAQGGLDPQFGTCKEAKAHGYGPYYQGQDPEYAWYRDADHDGIVCE